MKKVILFSLLFLSVAFVAGFDAAQEIDIGNETECTALQADQVIDVHNAIVKVESVNQNVLNELEVEKSPYDYVVGCAYDDFKDVSIKFAQITSSSGFKTKDIINNPVLFCKNQNLGKEVLEIYNKRNDVIKVLKHIDNKHLKLDGPARICQNI